MATMKTLNGYGFNATELNGKAASDYLQKTDTATNSAKLGGKAPEYYIQPRNLLDNSDFGNPVNQRGINYGANRNNGYTIDRWYYEQSAGAGDGYFGLTEYYVSLLAPSDGYSQMYQNLEKYAKLKGKNVTFAARVNRGSTEKIVCVTFTLGSIDVGLNLFEDGNLKLYSVDDMNILIRATGAEEFQFIWAALYEGSYTADTLPPYVPKGYAAELAECQRYYRVFHVGGVGKNNYIGGEWPITPSLRIDRPTSKLIGVIMTNNGETTISAGGFNAYMSYIRMDCLITSSGFNWWQATYEVSADL